MPIRKIFPALTLLTLQRCNDLRPARWFNAVPERSLFPPVASRFPADRYVTEQARNECRQLIQAYPAAPEAKEAEEMLRKIEAESSKQGSVRR
jgi:hypothetical protein